MTLVRTNLLGQITNSTGTTNFTTSAFTPANSSLLVVAGVFVENAALSDPTSAFVISDSLGTLTWTQQLTAVVSPTSFPTLIKIWTTPITTGASMTVTLSTGGLNRLGYAVSIVCYTGYDTSTPIGTTLTSIQNGGFGTAPNPISLTLPQAPLATSEVFAAIGIDKSTANTTPGSTFTEIHDVTDTANDVSLESEVRTGSTSTTVDWVDLRPGGGNLFNYAAAIIEVRQAPAGGGGASPPPDRFGARAPRIRTLARRGKFLAAPPQQGPQTTWTPINLKGRVSRFRPFRRGRFIEPGWPQAINPIPFQDVIWNFGHLGLKWVLNVVTNGKWKTGNVEGLKWTVGDIDRSKWTFGLAGNKWSIGGVVVPNPDIPLSSLSLEYVRVPVSATVNGAAINPTADTVKMAFLSGASTQPQVSDWKSASWDSVSANGTYFAQCLVGPGGATTLSAGTYYVWIQITDNPEVPVRQVGVLQVV